LLPTSIVKILQQKTHLLNIGFDYIIFICCFEKHYKILKMKTLLIVTLLFAVDVAVMAQTTPPPPPGGGPPGFPIPGIVYALIAALGYGAYKNYTNSKK